MGKRSRAPCILDKNLRARTRERKHTLARNRCMPRCSFMQFVLALEVSARTRRRRFSPRSASVHSVIYADEAQRRIVRSETLPPPISMTSISQECVRRSSCISTYITARAGAHVKSLSRQGEARLTYRGYFPAVTSFRDTRSRRKISHGEATLAGIFWPIGREIVPTNGDVHWRSDGRHYPTYMYDRATSISIASNR